MMILAASAAMVAAQRRGLRWVAPAGAAGLIAVVAPAVTIAALVFVAAAAGVIGYRRKRPVDTAGEVVVLAELAALGMSAGLTFIGALRLAVPHVSADLGNEVAAVLRDVASRGAATALAEATGSGRDLYLVAARATATGASIRGAVASFVADQRAAERTRQLEAARRLPVRLLFPLALLILPGFMVLTVGLALLDAVDRLGL